MPPAIVVHCDWSLVPRKRWMAVARRNGGRWAIGPPEPVGEVASLFGRLAARAGEEGPLFAGFDFPIGLPRAYGERTGLPDFRAALAAFGTGDWSEWYDVSRTPGEISIRRPFYPARPGGRRKAHLIDGLGIGADALLRDCERRTARRNAACSLFWTLGGNQVGKAAITGWRDLLAPAAARLSLWPFDGTLAELLARGGVVIAETYPGEAHGQIGLPRPRGWSKRRQSDRAALAHRLQDWLDGRDADPGPGLHETIATGFGRGPEGEDRFDAVIGLFGMLDVLAGRLPPDPPRDPALRRWEGWILGQRPGLEAGQ